MNRLFTCSTALIWVVLTACNDKKELPGISAESEPNDTFSTADLIGTVNQNGTDISLSCDVEFDDLVNDDLSDHFLFLASFDGNVTFTVTPVEVTADLRVIEELSATTDGATFNVGGAGAAETGSFAVLNSQSFHFRIETTLANTAYTLELTSPTPLTQGGNTGSATLIQRIEVDADGKPLRVQNQVLDAN